MESLLIARTMSRSDAECISTGPCPWWYYRSSNLLPHRSSHVCPRLAQAILRQKITEVGNRSKRSRETLDLVLCFCPPTVAQHGRSTAEQHACGVFNIFRRWWSAHLPMHDIVPCFRRRCSRAISPSVTGTPSALINLGPARRRSLQLGASRARLPLPSWRCR